MTLKKWRRGREGIALGGMVRGPYLEWEASGWDSDRVINRLHVSVALMAPGSTRSQEWKGSRFSFFPDILLWNISVIRKSGKNRIVIMHTPTTWVVSSSSINVILHLLHHLSVRPSTRHCFGAFQCKLQTSVLFTVNIWYSITYLSPILLDFCINLFICRLHCLTCRIFSSLTRYQTQTAGSEGTEP